MESQFPAPAVLGEGGTTPEFNLGDRMRKAMRDAGMSPQVMAEYLGCSRTSVSNWTCSRITPDTRTLRLWALRTGVSYGWLTGEPTEAAS
jgi:transcriptional regulator with XRE-family HTH domain